jgi:hypothetical protein
MYYGGDQTASNQRLSLTICENRATPPATLAQSAMFYQFGDNRLSQMLPTICTPTKIRCAAISAPPGTGPLSGTHKTAAEMTSAKLMCLLARRWCSRWNAYTSNKRVYVICGVSIFTSAILR